MRSGVGNEKCEIEYASGCLHEYPAALGHCHSSTPCLFFKVTARSFNSRLFGFVHQKNIRASCLWGSWVKQYRHYKCASNDAIRGWQPAPAAPRTRFHCCRCSLPGLTGFTISRCEGTRTGRHKNALTQSREMALRQRAAIIPKMCWKR